jgi:ribosomal protein L14
MEKVQGKKGEERMMKSTKTHLVVPQPDWWVCTCSQNKIAKKVVKKEMVRAIVVRMKNGSYR